MDKKDCLISTTNGTADEAIKKVREQHPIVLITGKAGTGKSTLIKKILNEGNVHQIVLSPTGLAATNVGGQTIH